jgi:hypothetical protein
VDGLIDRREQRAVLVEGQKTVTRDTTDGEPLGADYWTSLTLEQSSLCAVLTEEFQPLRRIID